MKLKIYNITRNTPDAGVWQCNNLLCNAILEPPYCGVEIELRNSENVYQSRLTFCQACKQRFVEAEGQEVRLEVLERK